MAGTYTAPGVYVQEVPSGVRTITGVSTSVTAFVGKARRGPMERAVRVLNFGEFERRFGGVTSDSEMSYAVHQFFANGGSQAWIVRLALSSSPATGGLVGSAQAVQSQRVLDIEARDEGFEGNRIRVRVAASERDPENTFDLRVSFEADASAPPVVEEFLNVSMNSQHPRYVVSRVNGSSQLITLQRTTEAESAAFGAGTSTGKDLGSFDVQDLLDDSHSQLRVQVNGEPPVTVDLEGFQFGGGTAEDHLAELCAEIQGQVRNLVPGPSGQGFECAPLAAPNAYGLAMTSNGGGEFGAVRVLPGDRLDVSRRLGLGRAGGGTEVDAAALILPVFPPVGNEEAPLVGGAEEPYGDGDVGQVFLRSRTDREGIYALEDVDLFNLLCLPGVSNPTVIQVAATYCAERRAFLLVDPPRESNTRELMLTYKASLNPPSSYAAVFYPWIRISDPVRRDGPPRAVPPSGTLAGLFARTDSQRGVWKAPAGTEAGLRGVRDVAHRLTDDETGILNPRGINCLRVFPTFGPVCWGSRTLSGDDLDPNDYKYIPVRRLALFIEESLYRGSQWVVFEPNDEPLWAQIRLSIGAFMNDLFRQGAFQGSSPQEAYLVKCDKETTTQNDINKGIVNILVGFAPLKPAEFVILRIQQLAGQVQT